MHEKKWKLKFYKFGGRTKNGKCKEMLGVAGWISPQEREKGISSQICLEYWDGDLDLNLLIAERECVYLTFKKIWIWVHKDL